MEINRITYQEAQFEDLDEGDVFNAVNEENFYMKTSKAYEYDDNTYYILNAVDLGDGTLVKFDDKEEVRIPKKVVLTID